MSSLWAVAFAVVSLLNGQEEVEQKRFRVLGYGDGLFQGIFFEREGFEEEVEKVELVFSPDRKSRPYQLPASQNRVVFYREVENGDKPSARVEVGTVDWKSESTKATLVFLEPLDFVEGQEYRILFIDESPAVWGAGCFRFLNLSGAALEGRLGNRGIELGQGLSEVYSMAGEERKPIRLSLFLDWEGERSMVYSARTIPDAKFGKLVVVKPPLELGSLRVRVDTLW